MRSCWKSIREETRVRCGKGHQFIGLNCPQDCGGVDRYNEEGCERASLWFVSFEQ